MQEISVDLKCDATYSLQPVTNCSSEAINHNNSGRIIQYDGRIIQYDVF